MGEEEEERSEMGETEWWGQGILSFLEENNFMEVILYLLNKKMNE